MIKCKQNPQSGKPATERKQESLAIADKTGRCFRYTVTIATVMTQLVRDLLELVSAAMIRIRFTAGRVILMISRNWNLINYLNN